MIMWHLPFSMAQGAPSKNHRSMVPDPKTIMKSMDHPNIIKLYETFVSRRPLFCCCCLGGGTEQSQLSLKKSRFPFLFPLGVVRIRISYEPRRSESCWQNDAKYDNTCLWEPTHGVPIDGMH